MNLLNRERWGDTKYAHAHDAFILPEGYRSGQLTVLQHLGSNRHSKFIYRCICTCGNTTICVGSVLRKKRITRCHWCSRRENAKKMITAHYSERYYKKRGPLLERILSLRSDLSAKEISNFVNLSSRTISTICRDHGLGGYIVRGRGAPGVLRPKK
jgi:hypothetical protein